MKNFISTLLILLLAVPLFVPFFVIGYLVSFMIGGYHAGRDFARYMHARERD